MSELDQARVALVAGAAVVAGPGASIARIEDLVVALALMAEADSPVMKRLAQIQSAQRFRAVIEEVTVEASSTRAIVSLLTDDVTDKKPDGREQIRTERTDHPAGALMERLARNLIGHSVLVYKVVEDIGPERRVRILVHLTDLGPAETAKGVGGGPAGNAAPTAGEGAIAPGASPASPPAKTEDHNFLPYWTKTGAKFGWHPADMVKKLQGTAEGREVRTLRTLDPYSEAGIKLEVMIKGGRN